MSLSKDSQESIRALATGRIRGQPMETWKLIESAWTALQNFILRQFIYKRFPKNLWEDCGQIVMERVWKYRKSYRGNTEGAFWAWLRTICDNERKRYLEKEARHPASLTEYAARSGIDGEGFSKQMVSNGLSSNEGSTPMDEVLDKEVQRALKAALSRLSEKQRMIVELMYGKSELTERAAAEVMGCSPSYVHKLKEQAIELLKQHMEKKNIE